MNNQEKIINELIERQQSLLEKAKNYTTPKGEVYDGDKIYKELVQTHIEVRELLQQLHIETVTENRPRPTHQIFFIEEKRNELMIYMTHEFGDCKITYSKWFDPCEVIDLYSFPKPELYGEIDIENHFYTIEKNN